MLSFLSVLDYVVILVPERFFQNLMRGFGLLPAEHDSPQNAFRVVEDLCRLCAAPGPEKCSRVCELFFQLCNGEEPYPNIDVSVEIGEVCWFLLPIRDTQHVDVAEGSGFASRDASVHKNACKMGILTSHKGRGPVRSLIVASPQLALRRTLH